MALGRWSLLAEEQGLLGVDFRFSRSVGASPRVELENAESAAVIP
jgi:hypothetical protein